MNALTQPLLFANFKEMAFFFIFFLSLLCSTIFWDYQNFKEIKEENFYRGEFKVLNHYHKYTKHHKKYSVLKLRHKNFTFYTTSWVDLPNLIENKISLIINTEKITFLDFMMGFYTFSFDLNILETKNLRTDLRNYISNLHQQKLVKELFSAIFLAIPPSMEVREKIVFLGIAHLIAISGFHLGLLSFILFLILKIPYQFFQNRFFPYRNKKVDLTTIILLLLFCYLIFTNSPPSLIRAFIMMIFLFYLHLRNYKILLFSTLFVIILLIISIFPKLFFSVAFWFSIAGIFYIYLFLHHFKHLNKILIFILIHFWVYLLMIPLTHIIFIDFTFYQLFSPIISMLFIPFYPIEILLHITPFANILDPFIEKLFNISPIVYQLQTSYEFATLYIMVSLLSIKFKQSLYLLALILTLFFFYGDVTIDTIKQLISD